MESKEVENERNFDAADPTSLLTSIEFVSREVFRKQQLRAFQMMRGVGQWIYRQSNEVDVHEEKRRRGVHRFRWQHQIFIRESHLLNELRARSTENGGNNGSTSADGE